MPGKLVPKPFKTKTLMINIECEVCKKKVGLVIIEYKSEGMFAIKDLKPKSSYCEEHRPEV